MDLFEYEAKKELQNQGIPTPKSILISNISQIAQAAANLKPPFMVKAQVLSGGRGKAGGILSANSLEEAKEAASRLIGKSIKGLEVNSVLIEEKINIRKELFLAITIDRLARRYVVLASQSGGVNVEELAQKTAKAVIKVPVNPLLGVNPSLAQSIARQIGYSGYQLAELSSVITKLYCICQDNDAELVEINPLAETKDGFVAVDARMTIDDNALFRQPKYANRASTVSPQEALALKNNVAYVKLEGDIGVVGNGAGLVMATLDLLNLFGGKPANFLDLGGGASLDSILIALRIVFGDARVRVVFVNVLGGITHCDDVARAILQATSEVDVGKPLVVRLVGTNQQEGQRILKAAGVNVYGSMEEAAMKAVRTSKQEQL